MSQFLEQDNGKAPSGMVESIHVPNDSAVAIASAEQRPPPPNDPTKVVTSSVDSASDRTVCHDDEKAAPVSPAETLKEETATPATSQMALPSVALASQSLQQTLSINNLEQEVGQVIGTFNSWWGGVKKQSASALSSIKADIDKTVSQAQADLEYLKTAKVEIVRKSAEEGQQSGPSRAESSTDLAPTESDVVSDNASTHSLLDRLSSSTTQLQHTLQSTFQSTVASAASNPALSDPSQLRAQLAKNLRLSSAKANLQLSMKQAERMAEEYLRKGDQWVKDAEKWMGDAVKVVPPDADDQRYIATSFDGADFYSFSTSTSRTKAGTLLFDAEARTPRSSTSTIAASRKDTLLQRLRQDKQLLLVDPMGAEETTQRHEEFSSWIREHWPEADSAKEQEVQMVGEIRMALVPEMLSDEQFWQRYLFHKHMIEAEIEKRRKLLAVPATSQEAVDDFSWDDEPEDNTAQASSTSKTISAEVVPASPARSAVKSNIKAVANSTTTSPRDSEESYDLVSDQGSRAAMVKPLAKGEPEDDEDSDWE